MPCVNKPPVPDAGKNNGCPPDGLNRLHYAHIREPIPALSSGRLPFLDGLRGLAALNVAFTHTWYVGTFRPESGLFAQWSQWITHLLLPGHWSVCTFMVLSGFCLAGPVAQTKDLLLSGGTWAYLKRRAWRILPSYYAALLLSLLLITLFPILTSPESVWHILVPALDAGPLVSHLLLVHNIRADWIAKILSPAWSIAIEWQIYFLLPLVLLPIWRRFGWGGVFLAGISLGIAAPKIVGGLTGYTNDIGWLFISLFAFGAVASAICYSTDRIACLWRNRAPWAEIAATLGGLLILSQFTALRDKPSQDLLVGLAASALIISCFLSIEHKRPSPAVRILAAKWPVALGAFSYSLYLMHAPVLMICDAGFHAAGYSTAAFLLLMVFIALPLVLLLSYLFHLAIERPLLVRQRLRLSSSLAQPLPGNPGI